MKLDVLAQDENQIADPCARDLLDGHVHTARLEVLTTTNSASPPHEEDGITQDARGVLWFEGLRDMPSQRTEARFRLDANGELPDDIAGGAAVTDLDIHAHEIRSVVGGSGWSGRKELVQLNGARSVLLHGLLEDPLIVNPVRRQLCVG